MTEQVTARTLRRHTVRLENRSAELHTDLQQLLRQLEELNVRLGVQQERLRVIERDYETMTRYVGIIAKHSKVNVPIAEPALASIHPLRRV